MNLHKDAIIKLHTAVKENQETLLAIHQATFKGDGAPPENLKPNHPLIARLHDSYKQLAEAMLQAEQCIGSE